MPLTRSDSLDVWRRSLSAAPAEPSPEGPGALGTALNYLGRPVSGVMGGLFGALSDDLTVKEGARQGITGERYFGAYDFLVEGGFDPDARSTHLTGLALDVFNPLDPLTYVGLGFTKAGKVAKGLSKFSEGAETLGKVTNRTEAAAKGLWSPVTIAGQRVVPKGLSVAVARPLDAVENRIRRTAFVETMGKYLGGVKKYEEQFPGISSMMQGARRGMEIDQRQFVDELVSLEESFLAKGASQVEAERLMEDVTSLLELPETRLVRAERSLELVEEALAGKYTDWLPEGIPVEEAEAITQVNFANQRAVDRRVAELSMARAAVDGGAVSGPVRAGQSFTTSTGGVYHVHPGGSTKRFSPGSNAYIRGTWHPQSSRTVYMTPSEAAKIRVGPENPTNFDIWAKENGLSDSIIREWAEGNTALLEKHWSGELSHDELRAAMRGREAASPEYQAYERHFKENNLSRLKASDSPAVGLVPVESLPNGEFDVGSPISRLFGEGKKELWELSRGQFDAAFPLRVVPSDFGVGSRVQYPVFHGSTVPGIEEFATRGDLLGGNTGSTNTKLGAFFADEEEVARFFGSGLEEGDGAGTLYQARLDLKNPLDLNNMTQGQVSQLEKVFPGFMEQLAHADRSAASVIGGRFGMMRWMVKQQPEHAQDSLKALGYDGIVVSTRADVPRAMGRELSLNQYVVFDSESIFIEQAKPLASHESVVSYALQRGYPVPREVVAEYPGLADLAAEVEKGRAPRPQDEFFLLKSVQVSNFAGDMPPMDLLVKRREELQGEVGRIQALWDDAGPELREAYRAQAPLFQEVREIFEGTLREYDPDVMPPIDEYVKHLFPSATGKLPQNVKRAQEAAAAERSALVAQLTEEGYSGPALERALGEQLGPQAALADAVDNSDVLKGDLDAFKQRQYNMTIAEFNEMAEAGGMDARFETNSLAILSAMRRDANRWKFGHDIHKFVLDKPGWTISGEEFAALSRGEQKQWRAMDFHMPWIKPEKDPFRGRYMRTEVEAVMASQMRGMGKLLTDDGLNGLLGVMSKFREWWTAWTLAPFPSTRVRDLVSDMVLGHMGGLNPAIDLVKGATGDSSYLASLALNSRRSNRPIVQGLFGNAAGNLDGVLAKVEARYGQKLSEEDLVKYMEIEGVLGPDAVRDLDVGKVLSDDPLMARERKKQGRARKMLGGLTLNPDKSPVIKAGFGVAQTTADFTRGALFLDTLKKVLPEAKTLDDALQYATAHVRRFQFDYTDLTQTERDVLKNIVPFYTFSAKNLPLQLTSAVTDPGRFSWVNRLYQGAWGQFDQDEVAMEDLPDWLADGLGVPINAVEMEDGTKQYAIWTPRGWLPQTELNELADVFRGKASTQILSRLSPLLKEPFEQMLNRDAFTMREIEDGTIRDVMGFPVNRRVGHLLNNIRLISEVDRTDPGGIFTKMGQQLGYWEDERPHRFTAPGPERATRFFTGLNIKGVVPVEQQERKIRDAEREANAAQSRAQYALRRGQRLEAEKFMEQVKTLGAERRESAGRLNELRRRNALEVARREDGR